MLQHVAVALQVCCRCIAVCCSVDEGALFSTSGTLPCCRVWQVCCMCIAGALQCVALRIKTLTSFPQVR